MPCRTEYTQKDKEMRDEARKVAHLLRVAYALIREASGSLVVDEYEEYRLRKIITSDFVNESQLNELTAKLCSVLNNFSDEAKKILMTDDRPDVVRLREWFSRHSTFDKLREEMERFEKMRNFEKAEDPLERVTKERDHARKEAEEFRDRVSSVEGFPVNESLSGHTFSWEEPPKPPLEQMREVIRAYGEGNLSHTAALSLISGVLEKMDS